MNKNHWTLVDGTYSLPGRSQVVVVEMMPEMKVCPGWTIQLFGPNDAVITTKISSVDRPALPKTPYHVGLTLAGFDAQMPMDNWLAAIQEPVGAIV